MKRVARNRRRFQKTVLKNIPYQNYKFRQTVGLSCENVIGYMPIPLGYIGPLIERSTNKQYQIPMATTEGGLVASTNRGAKAIRLAGGFISSVVDNGMTRSPLLKTESLEQSIKLKQVLDCPLYRQQFEDIVRSGSNHCKLTEINVKIVGRYLFPRFRFHTGNAMGMNMATIATEEIIKSAQALTEIPFELISVSSNYCTDKKNSRVNLIEGRGKHVVCQVNLSDEIIQNVLKTTPQKLIEICYAKNHIGSAIAGTLGNNNAHAANIIAAIFLATGQDLAQIVTSSQCITMIEQEDNNTIASVCLPCLEIGTIGGGTQLNPQQAALKFMLGKAYATSSGTSLLASAIAGTVLAGELSLLAALSAGHLVKAHLKYNRAKK